MSEPGTASSASRAPHLLYVAWGYPPSRSAGMYRALATANAFAQAGWDVTVLTTTRDAFERLTGTDEAAEASIDPRVVVERVPFDTTRGEPDLSKWSRSRMSSPLWWSFWRSSRERRFFPESNYGSWAPGLRAVAHRIHAERPVSLVIGSSNPHVDFVPGAELHRVSGVPYVMDYRDAWHLDVYSGRRIGSRRSRSARWERRALAGAAEAWFVNPAIRDWHAEQYPEARDRYQVVANGFDPAFLDLHRDRRPDPRAGLTLGWLGTVYGPMPLRESLEAWRRARSVSPLAARSRLVIAGRLGHYATPDPATLELLNQYAADGVSYTGPVSKTGVSDVYRGFDALLLMVSSSPFVTSGKVFEYAATGLPIVSVHDAQTATTGILSEHPAWYLTASLDPDDIADAMIATLERASAFTPADLADSQGWAQRFSRAGQLDPRIAALRSVVEAGS
jgi:glycosyltransferase involved in cell wall biosynthesis